MLQLLKQMSFCCLKLKLYADSTTETCSPIAIKPSVIKTKTTDIHLHWENTKAYFWSILTKTHVWHMGFSKNSLEISVPRWYFFCGSFMGFFSVLRLLCLWTRLFICALWSPAEKGLTSWLSFVVSVSLSLSHWYPVPGVVLDCIDSWSLHPYLRCIFSVRCELSLRDNLNVAFLFFFFFVGYTIPIQICITLSIISAGLTLVDDTKV